MSTHWHSETAFKTVIGPGLLQKGYVPVTSDGFDREPAILPSTVLAFIRGIQPKERAKLESLHGDKTCEEMLSDLSKLIDSYGVLATLRHGFKEHRRTLHAACFKATLELVAELEARCAASRPGLTRQFHFSPRSEKWLGSQCSEIPSCVLLSLYFNKLIFIHLTVLSFDNCAPNTAQWLARRRSTPSLSD